MIFTYTIIAIFIAWIWVDFYRLIDIYEKEELQYFVLIFILGALSTQVTIFANRYFLNAFEFDLNGNLLHDLLFCVIEIGMLEEFSKLLPFLLFLLFFKKQINEPIDYLSYLCVSALGFSAAENIMYFDHFGPYIISGRSILSSLGHMMFTAFIGYGIILYKYKKVKLGKWIIPLFFFYGSLSHGIYNFWLMHEHAKLVGYFITVLFFLQLISLFANMLNNALNNSEFFSYKKVINSEKVSTRLLIYYFVIFVAQFLLITFSRSLDYAFKSLDYQTVIVVLIVFITSARLSRFKLIKNEWFALRLELPFHYKKVNLYKNSETKRRFAIRGEGYNEVYLNQYYQEFLWLNPLVKRRSYLGTSKKAFIEKKIFLHDNESYYVTKLFLDSSESRYEYVLLKPKLEGKSFTEKKSPIIAVLRTKQLMNLEDRSLKINHFSFIEWAYPKKFKNWKK